MNRIDQKYIAVSDFLVRLLKENTNTICLLVVFNLSSFVHLYMMIEYRGLFLADTKFFVVLAFNLLAEIFIVMFILSKFPRVFTHLFIFLTVIFFLLDTATLTLYRSLFDKGMFQVLLDTNIQEATEYVQDYFAVNAVKFFYAVPLLIILALCFKLGRIFVEFLLSRNIRFVRFFCVIMAMLSILLWLISVIFSYRGVISVTRMAILIPRAFNEIREYREVYKNLDAAKIEITYNQSDLPFVIFILGEATNRNHLGIYGYDKPTTPNFQKRLEHGDLIVFTDCISGATETMPTCKRLFTFYRNELHDDGPPWYSYTNLFDILKAAGYHTVWLSNQEVTGIYGNVPRAYADRCNEKFFTTLHDTETMIYEFDEKILPLLDESLSKNSSAKNFYVLHLLGTHLNYRARYPDTFEFFRPEDEPAKEPLHQKYQAEYDNAILYNDFVVEEIIKRFEEKDALIIYISDHGEDVFEDGVHLGHGPYGDIRQFEIPMIVWMSDECKTKHPELAEKISAAKDRPFMTDDMIHALLDLMKIRTAEFDSRKSLFSADFDDTRKRIYRGREYKNGELISLSPK